jgi:dipeptidyl aminopeptidase/acylaminoacyl peptidase
MLFILFAAAPTLAEKRAFTIKDLYDIKQVVDPRYSPDGKSLLFLSSRDDKNADQLWRLPVDGGEALQVTDFSMAVTDPEWLPDGRRIVFFTTF